MMKILKLTIKELINIFEEEFKVAVDFSMTDNKTDVIEFLTNNADLNELVENLCDTFYIDDSLIEIEKNTNTTSVLKVDIIDTMVFLEEKFDISLSFNYSLNNSHADVIDIEFEII